MDKNRKNRWFNPIVTDTGWDKDLRPEMRRSLILKAHAGNLMESAHAMQALSNVTQDKITRIEAAKDAAYFFKENQRLKAKFGDRYIPAPPYHNGYHPEKRTGKPANVYPRHAAPRMEPPMPRITPRTPRIR